MGYQYLSNPIVLAYIYILNYIEKKTPKIKFWSDIKKNHKNL